MNHSLEDRYSTREKEPGLLCKQSIENPDYTLGNTGQTDGLIRVLKHGDTFAVFDRYGNIKPVTSGEEGVYHDGTRFASCLTLDIDGACPFFLSSTVRDDNDQLTVALTNPDLRCQNLTLLPLGSLHIARRVFLWRGVCYQEVTVENYSGQSVATRFRIRFAADYADIFEIQGMARKARGEDLPPLVEGSAVVLSYRGLDHLERRTRFEFSPAADISAGGAMFELSLEPREVARFYITVRCELFGIEAPRRLKFDEARARALDEIRSRKANACTLYGSNGQFNAWVNRALSDLHMMTTALPTGPYPYAGVPWFNTPFGRDGLITALECLWFWPDLARGVLSYLAQQQEQSLTRNKMPSRARSFMRCARERWRRSKRCRSAGITALSTVRLYSSCWPAPTMTERATCASSKIFGQTYTRRSGGSNSSEIGTATVLSSITDNPPAA